MGFGVWGLGFGVWGLGFGVWGLGLGFGVWSLEFGVWGLGFGGVWGLVYIVFSVFSSLSPSTSPKTHWPRLLFSQPLEYGPCVVPYLLARILKHGCLGSMGYIRGGYINCSRFQGPSSETM